MAEGAYRSQIALFDELVGERVIVRPYRPEDAAAHFAAVEQSRAYLEPWLPWVTSYHSVADSRDYIARIQAHWLLRDEIGLAIFDQQTGAYLGGTGLHPRTWETRVFEIGYWLRVTAAGHGYMAEAVRMLTDFAFERLDAQRVFIRCDARNDRSANVARRLGFVPEARLRNEMFGQDGNLRDTLIFALIPSDARPWHV
ncbi:MAG: GNAT family N-acetyltransferase [Ktedonobacterales bacterium]